MPFRILLVDDDELVLEATGRHLRRWGYVVATAASVAEAREVAEAFRPELVLLDRRLEDGDGLVLAGELQALLAPSPPPVLVLSASYDMERGGEGPVRRYLPKAIHTGRLRQLVAAALHGQRLSAVPPMA